ncbi:MAG: tyrosine-type recombinase/integrase [Deltaproteobacteria bacterium]|nr:tyrosine-type recombinase/integrase [Deltaproteobacteria bacterium]
MAREKVDEKGFEYQCLLDQLGFPEAGYWPADLPIGEHWLAEFSFPDPNPEHSNLVDSPLTMKGKSFHCERAGVDPYLRPLSGAALPGTETLKRHVHEKYRRNCSPNTLLSTVSSGRLFLGFLKQVGKEELHEIVREDLEAFVEREQDRGMKPATVRTRLANIQAFLVFLIREGIVDREVLERKIRIKLPETLPRAMDPMDVKQLLSVVEHVRDRALILVLLRTGMRIGEVLNTKVVDVNLRERKIQIPQAQKNAVGRVVYVSDDAREALSAWFAERDVRKAFVFYAQGKEAMTYAGARSIFVRYLRKADLADKGYSLHRLRHTFASEMLNAGMRLECLQQLLGHSSIEVTRRYARLTDVTREREYFHAMEIIEKGEIHGHYQLDFELQKVLEEKKLLRPYRKPLHQRS